MRVIGGYLKGKKLYQPMDLKTRPLKDIVKESIFNILTHSKDNKINFNNANILDLFSGSGSFGIECLSRGAQIVYFFENYKIKYDENATMVITPFNFLNEDKKIFPLSGLSNRTTIYCNENGYYSVYKSDRYGFNNDDNFWNKKNIKTLIIGDSFAHGACVNRADSIANKLKILSKEKVLNLGMGSTGPLLQLAILTEYGDLIDYENLIWFYYEGNDHYELNDELSDNILTKYFDENNFSQNLINRNS